MQEVTILTRERERERERERKRERKRERERERNYHIIEIMSPSFMGTPPSELVSNSVTQYVGSIS